MPKPPDKVDMAVRQSRRLAAILHADVVGYTRLMAADEEGTHARVVRHRETIGAIVAEHSGRLVGTAGDALLIEFASVVDAIRAATAAQERLVAGNRDLEPDKRVEFRIGINLGDVIADDGDLFGDGVNVAQRLEALAPPNGIAVSGPVFDQVRTREEFAFRGGSAVRVKNVPDPVRVYFVQPPGTIAGAVGGARLDRRKWLVPGAAAAALAIAVGAGASWWWAARTYHPTGAEEVGDGAAVERGRPVVAILPFRTRGGTETRAFFAEGMTEDLIAELSRYSNLLVLSWNAVAPYGDGEVAPARIGRELGAHYMASGSLSQTADRLRLTVELTDARRGVLLWSERYDESIEDVFAVQDRVAARIVEALAVGVTRNERERDATVPTDKLEAYEFVLQGRELMRQRQRDSTFEARALFERALAIDAGYADALVWFGWTHLDDILFGWTVFPDRSIAAAQDAAEKALALDDDNADGHALAAYVFLVRERFDQASDHVRRAIDANPSNPLAMSLRARLLIMAGRPEDALPLMQLVMRLDPEPGGLAVFAFAQALYSLGRDREAADLLTRFEGLLAEDNSAMLALLAACQAQLGLEEKAAATAARLRRINPFFDAGLFVRNFSRPPNSDRLAEGLAKAGLE